MLDDFTLNAVLIIFGIVASGIAGLSGGVYRKKTDQFKKRKQKRTKRVVKTDQLKQRKQKRNKKRRTKIILK